MELAPGPVTEGQALTSTEKVCLERLRWIIRLHWYAGGALYLLIVLQWALAPIPGGLLISSTLIATVYAYTAVGQWALRRWMSRREPEMPVFSRRWLNAIAAADIAVLCTANHLFGGPDNPGLAFFVIPMVVYGNFLPRRDSFLQAGFGVAILGVVFLGEHAGWLGHVCPPIEGYTCSVGSTEFVVMHYLSMAFLAFVCTYLATFIGNGLREEEAAARRLVEEQAALVELKGRFVSMASHEMRTPLTTILGASDMLSRYGDRLGPEERKAQLTTIADGVRHMTKLTEDVLTLGRQETRPEEMWPDEIDVAAACRNLAREMTSATVNKCRIALEVEEQFTARIPPRLLREVLSNLLSNAIKYSPEGGRVHLRVTRGDGQLFFVVEDHGIGIPVEDRARLFEPFYRGGNVRGAEGAGLGLTIVKRAVDSFGGTIAVESGAGVGTTFVVQLPVNSRWAA